jgi:glycosyltransferase involved in cell wall biosynthesis
MNQSYEPISVLIPIRNGSQYLDQFKKTMESSLSTLDQIVAIDDGSSDGTLAFLRKWEAISSKLVVLKTNGIGLVGSLNLGLKHSSNRWIARYDIDDDYEDNRIDLQRLSIKKEAVAIFSDYNIIDEQNRNYGFITSPILPSPTAISLANSVRTAHPSVLFNKEAVIEAGGYREIDFPAEDLSLWLRMAKIGEIISIPRCLLHYRVRKGSISSLKRENAFQKKHEVLKNISINEEDLNFCLGNMKEIFDFYDSFDKSEQRKILFIRDLLATSHFLEKYRSKTLRGITKEISFMFKLSSLNELFALEINKNRRIKLRHSLDG